MKYPLLSHVFKKVHITDILIFDILDENWLKSWAVVNLSLTFRLPWSSLVELQHFTHFHDAHLASPETYGYLQRGGEEPEKILWPMSSHLVLWEVHQVLFNSKISCERTDFAGEMLVKCIISTPVCQIPRTNIRNTGRALQFSFQWWAINMCHYFWRGMRGFDTVVANCLPKWGLFFNFHDFVCSKTRVSWKLTPYLKKTRGIWEACLQKYWTFFQFCDPAPTIPFCYLQDTFLRLSEVRIQSQSRRRSEERVRRESHEKEKKPKFTGESEKYYKPVEPVSWSKGYKVEDLESLNTLYFWVFCSIDKQCEHFLDKAGGKAKASCQFFPFCNALTFHVIFFGGSLCEKLTSSEDEWGCFCRISDVPSEMKHDVLYGKVG